MTTTIARPQVQPYAPPLQEERPSVRRVLAERGWCQNHFTNSRGNVCLLQAMALAFEGYEDDVFIDILLDRLTKQLETAPAVWNNVRGRTFDEVLAVADQIDDWLAEHWKSDSKEQVERLERQPTRTVRGVLEKQGNVSLWEAIDKVYGLILGKAISMKVDVRLASRSMRTYEEVLEVADIIDGWIAEEERKGSDAASDLARVRNVGRAQRYNLKTHRMMTST